MHSAKWSPLIFLPQDPQKSHTGPRIADSGIPLWVLRAWILKGSSLTEACQTCGQGRNPLQPWERLYEQTWQVPQCSLCFTEHLLGMGTSSIRGSWRSLIPGTTPGLQNVLGNALTLTQLVLLAAMHHRPSNAPWFTNKAQITIRSH